jgi:hypothetical protein
MSLKFGLSLPQGWTMELAKTIDGAAHSSRMQNLIETQWNVIRRMADWHYGQAQTWAELPPWPC